MATTNLDVLIANNIVSPGLVGSTGVVHYVGNSSVLPDGGVKGTDLPGFGLTPQQPFLTLDYDIGQCVAVRGDVVYAMPGHAETVSTAGGIALDVAGVSVIGLGNGALKPTLTFSATSATVAISANNTKFKNFKLVPSVDSVVSPLVVTGDDVDIDVEIQDATDLIEFVRAVTCTGVNRGTIKINYIGRTGGDACVNAIRLTNCTDLNIELYAYGKASTAWVEFITTACTNIRVNGVVYNSGTTNGSKNIVDTVTGSTWSAQLFDATAGASQSGGSGAALAFDDVSAIASNMNVPTADSTANVLERDVIGNKSDAAAATGVTTTNSLVAYTKAIVNASTGSSRTRNVGLINTDFTGTATRFTIANGPIRVKELGFLVTTALPAGANTCKFSFTPTGGSATDLCAATDTASAAAQQLFIVDGTKATALVKTTDVGILAAGQKQASELVLSSGVIQLIFSAGPPASGAAQMFIEYEPLNTSATVS